jgi:diguanylate cyclase (GGDEF)-like protein
MSDTREAPRSLRSPFGRYVATVTVLGLAFALWAVLPLRSADLAGLGTALWVIVGLIVLGELRPLFTAGAGARDVNGVATSTTFVFALLLGQGLGIAILAQAVATVIADRTKRKVWWRTSFNVAQYSVSLGAAAGVLALFGRAPSLTAPAPVDAHDLPALALAGLAYFLCNDGLVSTAVARYTDRPVLAVLREDLAYQALTTAALLALAPLVSVVAERSVGLLPLLLLPLYAVYKTAALSVQREHESRHDLLTGLPNRTYVRAAMAEALAGAGERGEGVAFFLLDLDRFKDVNDTLGHRAGDQVLTHVAQRLQSVVRPQDVVARLGGDEFAVLLPGVSGRVDAEDVATRIRSALAEPLLVDGVLLDLDAAIGVALFPDHASEPDSLMQRADVAMYLAKETRNGWETYSSDRDPHSTARLSLFGQLRRALETGELVLHYQPKLELITDDVVGVEALVRWQHPERGLVGPDEFIPIAEQTGLMRQLTAHVLDRALAQAAEWAAEGLSLRMAVNVSARDLHDPRFVDLVRDALDRAGVSPGMVELEITERVVMADPANGMETLHALARLGVRLSLDDFGTGYSSLAYLKRLPVTELKIDKSFVLRMDVDADDATIVRSTIDLAHGLGLAVVAEGVETLQSMQRLTELGCDAAQGYLLSRPLPAEQLRHWLLGRPAFGGLRLVAEQAAKPRTRRRTRVTGT